MGNAPAAASDGDFLPRQNLSPDLFPVQLSGHYTCQLGLRDMGPVKILANLHHFRNRNVSDQVSNRLHNFPPYGCPAVDDFLPVCRSPPLVYEPCPRLSSVYGPILIKTLLSSRFISGISHTAPPHPVSGSGGAVHPHEISKTSSRNLRCRERSVIPSVCADNPARSGSPAYSNARRQTSAPGAGSHPLPSPPPPH